MGGAVTEARSDAGSTRRVVAIVLIVLASLIGFFSVFALWIKRQALETDTWTQTSSQLLENEEIRDAVADFLVAKLYANVDVEDQIAQRLPLSSKDSRAQRPAGFARRRRLGRSGPSSSPGSRRRGRTPTASRTRNSWLLLDDELPGASTGGGVVTLDLRTILAQISNQVGIGGNLADKLPPDAAQIEILQADELEEAQEATDLLRTLAWFLTALTLVLYGVAIFINRGRRRETLRSVGIAFIVVGILVLFAHRIAGGAVVDALTGTAASEGPAQATWDIATSLLVATGQAIIGYGIVIVLAAWLAGPSAAATWVRRGATPYLRQPRFAYGGLVILLALIFWWNPTEATRRLPTSLLLIALLALGTELLRRQVIREFPDRVTTWSPEGTAQRLADRMRERRERRLASPDVPAAAAAPQEQRVSQLERLAQLRESGVLTDEELAEEKRRVLESA